MLEYAQLFGVLLIGGTLGAATMALLNSSRSRDEDEVQEIREHQDTELLNYIDRARHNVTFTVLDGRNWCGVMHRDTGKSVSVGIDLRAVLAHAKSLDEGAAGG